jgi:hypothetical protein
MAYRLRLIGVVEYGHFGEYMKSWKKVDDLMQARGWVSSRVLVPTAGPNNEIVAEFEYPDLATFEKENKAFLRRPRGVRGFPGRRRADRPRQRSHRAVRERAARLPWKRLSG